MTKITKRTPAELRALAAEWQQRADEEKGKSRANGWAQWELDAADGRRRYCETKARLCLDAASQLEGVTA